MSKWPMIRLRDAFAPKSGSVDPSKYGGEQFNYYSIPAFDVGQPEHAVGGQIGSSKKLVSEGDVLLSRIVPHIRRAWVVGPDQGRRSIASTEWVVFRHHQLLPRFIKWFLTSDRFHEQMMRTVAGVGGSLSRASVPGVGNIEIPLPPLAEQERIVRLLDEADAIRKLRAKADQRTADLIPAMFHRMFGDPITNPLQWTTAPVGVLGRVSTGSTPKTSRSDFYGGQVLFIRPAELDAFTTVNQSEVMLSDLGAGQARPVGPGAVLVSCIGQIGKTGLTSERSAFNQQINAVEFDDSVLPEFGLVCLNQLGPVLRARASNALLPILNKTQFAAIEMPVPPLELQEQFAQRILNIQEIQQQQSRAQARTESQFQAVLHEAFSV